MDFYVYIMIPSIELVKPYIKALHIDFDEVKKEELRKIETLGYPWPTFIDTGIDVLDSFFVDVIGENGITMIIRRNPGLRILLPFSNAIEIKSSDELARNVGMLVGIASQNFDGYPFLDDFPFCDQRRVLYGDGRFKEPWKEAKLLTNNQGFDLIINRAGGPLQRFLFPKNKLNKNYPGIDIEQIWEVNAALQMFLNTYDSLADSGIALIQVPLLPFGVNECRKLIEGFRNLLQGYGIQVDISKHLYNQKMKIVKGKDSPKRIIPANPFIEDRSKQGEYLEDGTLVLDFNRVLVDAILERLNPLKCPGCPFNQACRFHRVESNDIRGLNEIARSPVTGAEFADQTVRTAHRKGGFTTWSEVVFGPRGIRTATCSVVRPDGTLGEVIGNYPNEP